MMHFLLMLLSLLTLMDDGVGDNADTDDDDDGVLDTMMHFLLMLLNQLTLMDDGTGDNADTMMMMIR